MTSIVELKQINQISSSLIESNLFSDLLLIENKCCSVVRHETCDHLYFRLIKLFLFCYLNNYKLVFYGQNTNNGSCHFQFEQVE